MILYLEETLEYGFAKRDRAPTEVMYSIYTKQGGTLTAIASTLEEAQQIADNGGS